MLSKLTATCIAYSPVPIEFCSHFSLLYRQESDSLTCTYYLASYPGLCFFFFLSADSRIIMENEREEEENEEKKKRKKKQGLVWEVA